MGAKLWKWRGFIGVACGLGVAAALFGVLDGAASDRSTADAWNDCKRRVEAELANPATADFKQSAASITDSEIRGEVESQTGLGVPKTIRFTCAVDDGRVTGAQVQQVD